MDDPQPDLEIEQEPSDPLQQFKEKVSEQLVAAEQIKEAVEANTIVTSNPDVYLPSQFNPLINKLAENSIEILNKYKDLDIPQDSALYNYLVNKSVENEFKGIGGSVPNIPEGLQEDEEVPDLQSSSKIRAKLFEAVFDAIDLSQLNQKGIFTDDFTEEKIRDILRNPELFDGGYVNRLRYFDENIELDDGEKKEIAKFIGKTLEKIKADLAPIFNEAIGDLYSNILANVATTLINYDQF